MTRIADTQDVVPEYDAPTSNNFQIDVPDLVGVLRRGWLKILVPTLLGLVGTMGYLAALEPSFKATTRLVIERSGNQYVKERVNDGPGLADADLWSQKQIIASESIVLPVVRALNLAEDPEFNSQITSPGSASASQPSLFSRAKQLLWPSSLVAARPQAPERIALDEFNRHLEVARDEGPNVLSITFESRNPETAAKVANAIADAYQAAAISQKFSTTKVATGKMQDRLTDLKTKAADAERVLLEYKVANGLVGSRDRTVTSEQLGALNSRLAEARVAVAETKVKLDRLDHSVDVESKDGLTPDNDVISRLRTLHLDLASKAAEIETRVGKNHEAAVKLNKRMKEIRTAIVAEQKRLSGSFQKDYTLAQARYSEIASTLATVMGEESSGSQTQARVRELESAAETHRSLYNTMLQRFSETARADGQQSFLADARIVTPASIPLRPEVAKRRALLLGAGTLLGTLLGLALVLAKDFPLGVFRTPQQVKDATGIFSVALPQLPARTATAQTGIYQHALDAPFSRFAETIRTIGAAVKKSQASGGKVFSVISATPQEGKTVIATNLAHLSAIHGSTRTLLIDTDFHQQSLTRCLAPRARVGLKEALEDPNNLATYLTNAHHPNLDILPCPLAERIPNAAELLGSPGMKKLMDVARASYDLVIMEVAPVAAIVDFRMVEPLCDGHIFVVAWSNTSQRVVQETLADTPTLAARALCAVLNKVDPKALRSIESYKGNTREYYQSKPQRVVPVPKHVAAA